MTLPKRKPTRLREYDYSSPGAYFITICSYQKLHLFGKIKNGKMQLNDFGKYIDTNVYKGKEDYFYNKKRDCRVTISFLFGLN